MECRKKFRNKNFAKGNLFTKGDKRHGVANFSRKILHPTFCVVEFRERGFENGSGNNERM